MTGEWIFAEVDSYREGPSTLVERQNAATTSAVPPIVLKRNFRQGVVLRTDVHEDDPLFLDDEPDLFWSRVDKWRHLGL